MNRDSVLRDVALEYVEALKRMWGDALVSAALFGSVARAEAGPQSDIDLLIIARNLPPGRLSRQKRLQEADDQLEPRLAALRKQGVFTEICPILKTPEEAMRPVPLYLDLIEDAVILYDPEGFLARILARLRSSLERLGARRVQKGKIRYWELKPDYRPGEVFHI